MVGLVVSALRVGGGMFEVKYLLVIVEPHTQLLCTTRNILNYNPNHGNECSLTKKTQKAKLLVICIFCICDIPEVLSNMEIFKLIWRINLLFFLFLGCVIVTKVNGKFNKTIFWPVLKPNFNLSLSETQLVSHLYPSPSGEVVVGVELFL